MFVMENALYLTMSQGMLYLKDPTVQTRDKQLLKRELATELVTKLYNRILTDSIRIFFLKNCFFFSIKVNFDYAAFLKASF